MTARTTSTSGRGWAYTGATLGGLVSIAANVAHSFIPPTTAPTNWHPEPGAVVGAIVWPVFLFVAVEILARVAWPTGWSWQILRWGGLLPVALVAAIVSYRHLSGLLHHYGEEPIVYILGPLAVDGLMVMATGALLATGQLRVTTTSAPSTVDNRPAPAVPAAPVTTPSTVDIPTVSTDPAPEPVKEPAPAPTPAVVAARITTKPTPSTRTTPAPKPAPVDRATRTRPSNPVTTAASLPAASTDPSVNAQAPAQLALPLVSPELLDRATQVARKHRSDNGTRITPGQLAVRLKVTTEQATNLLASIDDQPVSTPTVNGRRTEAAR
jgi:hypothetical protein